MSPRQFVLPAAALLLLYALPAAAADGPALFKAKCAMCHGPDGKGATAMGRKLGVRALGSADVQKQSDGDLMTIIRKGKGKMPPYAGKLSDDEVKALVTHIRSLAG